ncbi:MAG: c-type cytochrome domain-containing protein [Isosphaeraceae bacterium]
MRFTRALRGRRRSRVSAGVALLACALLSATVVAWAQTPTASKPAASMAGPGRPKVEYNRDVRPILSDNCFLCHGPDAKTRKGKLRLDLRDDAVRDRDGHAAIVPGKVDDSELLARIVSDDELEQMPPPPRIKRSRPRRRRRSDAGSSRGPSIRRTGPTSRRGGRRFRTSPMPRSCGTRLMRSCRACCRGRGSSPRPRPIDAP